jgi:hypothetical protein
MDEHPSAWTLSINRTENNLKWQQKERLEAAVWLAISVTLPVQDVEYSRQQFREKYAHKTKTYFMQDD